MKKKTLAVVGVGSAGILSLSHFCSVFDNSWDIVSIYNPEIKIIGIGESTNPAFISNVEYGLNFSMLDDIKELDGTYKFATRFIDWKEHYIDSPLLEGRSAIHFNNFKFKEFAFKRLKSLWPNKFKIIEGNVDSLTNILSDDAYQLVQATVNGNNYYFDYVIDCRGFPSDYTDYTVCENMPVNRCLVHNIEKPGDWNYTGHRATLDGWMFEIPLLSRRSYGYLFNDTITPCNTARENFSKLIDVPLEMLNNIEYSFKSYYSKKAVDGRIFKSGNRFGFFEPMSATSMYMYSKLNSLYEQHILASENNNPFGLLNTNDEATTLAKRLQDLICFFYHGGSKYDTEFWKMAKHNCSEHLNSSGLIEYLKESLIDPVRNGNPFSPNLNVVYSARSHVHFDRLFEHYYFTDPIK
jgi:tryptophan halogenase